MCSILCVYKNMYIYIYIYIYHGRLVGRRVDRDVAEAQGLGAEVRESHARPPVSLSLSVALPRDPASWWSERASQSRIRGSIPATAGLEIILTHKCEDILGEWGTRHCGTLKIAAPRHQHTTQNMRYACKH